MADDDSNSNSTSMISEFSSQFDIPKSKCQEIGAEIDSHINGTLSSIISEEFDPEVIATFRKSLEDLPPTNPFHLKHLEVEKQQPPENNFPAGGGGKQKVVLVLYFTSLRVVRKTYEECFKVRMILKGLGVRVDERDVSMHSGFREEIKELLGERFNGGITLPMVFLGSKYMGGAEEIRRMHEEGELEKSVEDCEEDDGTGRPCDACGDIRFLPCETCSGSCKVYYEDEDEDEDEEDADGEEEGVDGDSEFGFKRCPDCNENGVIRCPICCD